MYTYSNHAMSRAAQRNVPEVAVDLLLRFGERRVARNGCYRIVLSKSAARKAKRYLGTGGTRLIDEARRFVVITNEQDGKVVSIVPGERQYLERYCPWKD